MKALDQKRETLDEAASLRTTELAKNLLLAVNFFIETNRLEPYVAVYLIVVKGWSEFRIGIISAVMNLVAIIFQIPAGDFIDKTSYKKTIAMVTLLVVSVTTACVGWTSNFWVVLLAKSIEGFVSAIFLPVLMSFLFGICTTAEEIPTFIATNEVVNKIGSVLFTLCSGLIAYFLYPDTESIFYLLGAGGVMAALFTALIPSSAIDTKRARQLRREAVGEDENNDKQEDSSPEAISYGTLLKDKNILAFAIATFFYHFANAALVPLVSQYVAIGDKRNSLVFTSAALMIFYIFQAITAQLLRTIIEKVTPKMLLVYAHIVLLVRCAAIVAMIEWWDNKFALTATQALDGIGAGIYDTLIPIAVGQMTENTGRFGFTYSLILTCWRIGHGASFLLGECIAHAVSYKVAFLTHGGIGIISLMLLMTIVHFPPLAANKIRRFHPFIDEEMMRCLFRKRVMGALKEIGGELSIDGIYEVFKSMDEIKSDGALDRSELKLFLENLSYASNVESAEDEHVDSNMIFDAIDTDNSGQISFIEFILYLEEASGNEFSPQIKILQHKARRAVGKVARNDQLTLYGLREVFKKMDEDKSSSLSKEEMRQFMNENDEAMSNVELDVLYKFMAPDKKGRVVIKLWEFMNFLDMIEEEETDEHYC